MGPPPVVTGISPKEGPPGTRVTIRGEFLGNKPTDLIGLTICGVDCLLSAEWKSATKVVVRTGGGRGRGSIVVTTSSGGVGTSLVEFRGYVEAVGPLKESAVWPESEVLPAAAAARLSAATQSSTSALLDDPLGLSVETEESTKLRTDELEELFPGCDGEISSERFAPGWFLLEHHLTTSFDDLQSGLHFLRRKVQSHKQGHLSFLKGNVASVMEQLDTLDNLRVAFNKDVDILGTNERTLKLEEAINGCIRESGEMFEGVLRGRELAEKHRSSLALLTRYRSFLTLPTTLTTAFNEGRYDTLAADYARAKNLFAKTEVNLFKKVLIEVEKKIDEFKINMKEQLQTMPNNIENQRKIVRCLNQLEVKEDIGFMLVQTHYAYILQTIKQISQGTSGSNTASSLLSTMAELLPPAWNLSQSYLAGDLQPKPNPDYKHLLKVGLVNECLTVMTHSVLASIDASNNSSSPAGGVMSPAGGVTSPASSGMNGPATVLTQATSVLVSIKALPNITDQSLEPFNFLIEQLRLLTIKSTLKSICEQARTLGTKEEWTVQYDMKFGSTTQMGSLLSNLLSETVSLFRECGLPVQASPTAADEVLALTIQIFSSFFKSMEELVGAAPESDGMLSQVMAVPPRQPKSHSGIPDWEDRLVMVISNSLFVRDTVLPEWAEKIATVGGGTLVEPAPVSCRPDKNADHIAVIEGGLPAFAGRVLRSAKSAARQLESMLVAAYLDAKSDPLVGTIEPSMYFGHFDWDTDIPTDDVSPYAKEIIANITVILAQVEQGCGWLKNEVMPIAVEAVGEEISRLFLSVGRPYSHHGAIQAHLDLSFLLLAASPFLSPLAERYFAEAVESLPTLSTEDRLSVKKLLEKMKSQMHMQLPLHTLV